MINLERMLHPKSVAIIGGGTWCVDVVKQCQKMGFDGDVWCVHPTRKQIEGVTCFTSVDELPTAPDACFIGVNRFATIDVVRALNRKGAKGAICFASGFSEAVHEDAQGADLQTQLLDAAGDMAVLGPNCYGFINYLDGALLWPDQHGGERVDSGVAIITQSSNIVINLTMQMRGLPVAFVSTVGNQAQIGLADMGCAMLNDPRVTALGLHIEGIDDLEGFQALTAQAERLGKPIIALKVGTSDQAQAATISHTASLAGSDAGARALFARLGVAQVADLSTFLEALKVAHVCGYLDNAQVVSMSCSGGEASLMADLGQTLGVSFPPLSETQKAGLRAALGPMVALANPLDYHTYIWGDPDAMTATFSAAIIDTNAMGLLVLDFPRSDRCETQLWKEVIPSILAAQKASKRPMGIIGSIVETMPEKIAKHLISCGVVPFCGMVETMSAVASCGARNAPETEPLLLPYPTEDTVVISEAEAKEMLACHGVHVPKSRQVKSSQDAANVAAEIGFPIVLKGEGIAHKTEAGAVILNMTDAQMVEACAAKMPCKNFLVEEMVTGGILELLIGVVLDPAHGYVLTIAAGGQLTEILDDKVSLLIPAPEDSVINALKMLRIYPLINGYRGGDSADVNAILETITAVQEFVTANQGRVSEVEINPLICTKTDAIAADALIKLGERL
jgi:acyl-CoA synthetase (NDP forming)